MLRFQDTKTDDSAYKAYDYSYKMVETAKVQDKLVFSLAT